MNIEYEFTLDEGQHFAFKVNTDRSFSVLASTGQAKPWTELEHCKCSACPLQAGTHTHCPAALDLQEVVEAFAGVSSTHQARVVVKTPERAYVKDVELEEALRALMGLIMSTSACPLLGELKPMGLYHLPFHSSDEYVVRSVSFYLLQQYLIMKDGGTPDWELKGLMERNQKLQTVNQDFWKRFQKVCQEDSAIKALMSFFSLSSSMSYSMELQIQKMRRKLMGNRTLDF